jgi:hypothetical protein
MDNMKVLRDMQKIHFANTQYGFEWGAAKIERCFSDDKKKTVTLRITTDKGEIQVYVTKTGKVRVHDYCGEWKPDKRK